MMSEVLFLLAVLTSSCEPYSKKPQTAPNRNQRIIKVQGPPHFNHFYGYQKPVRKRPFGGHHDEFIRPNHPPPIPPFFNGPSTNHVKHLPRPPPHIYHKAPSYGLGFPYKSLANYRPIKISKDQFRIESIKMIPLRTTSSSSSSGASISTSTTYHSPTFTSSSSFVSSPVSHIISSDDNNGPIREIPAPNLAPKPHETSFGILNDVHGIGSVGGVSLVGGIEGVSSIGEVNGLGVKIHGADIGGVLHGVGDISGGGGVHGDISGVGSLHGVSGGVAIHGVSEGGGIHGVSGSAGEISDVASVSGVTHLDPGTLLHSVTKHPNGVNLDAIVKDQGLEVNTYLKESAGDVHHGKGPTVEIANFDEGSSLDVTKLIKDADETSNHHSGYEVTEHHNHLPSNDQIIKGHDGTKLYYAPDPDPSLPVHKVPPTNDPHSTPSNGQNINVYIPQVSHGIYQKYPYVQGGPVGGHLSSQELFQLMHGYPTVISQPVVAFVGQPQAAGVILPNGGHSYFQQNSGGYVSGQYSQGQQEGNDITQYLNQPEIHNLIHNSPERHQTQESIGGSHSSVVSQTVYSPQNQYQAYAQSQQQQQQPLVNSGSNLGDSSSNFPVTEINHNYQYEPEASETENRNSLTVIRQANEGTLNSETVKELLLEDSVASGLSKRSNIDATESPPTILHLKNIPEVPFYTTLPNKQAAEALASLQAAGSIASKYMSKIKITRGDQDPEEEFLGGGNSEAARDGGLLKSESVQLGSEKTHVEIQKSVPLFETSISAKNLIENEDEEEQSESEFAFDGQDDNESGNLDFKEDVSNETFGKRLRPK